MSAPLQVVKWLFVYQLVLVLGARNSNNSLIGYFENYGWPSYGIVKPFWMAPFSAHRSRPLARYIQKHYVISAGVIKL